MNNPEDIKAYEEAKKRVKKEKGFYGHLITYIVMNIIVFIFQKKILEFIDPDVINQDFLSKYWFSYITTLLFWGIGLFFHWFWAFNKSFIFNKKWEERKTKEFVNQED